MLLSVAALAGLGALGARASPQRLNARQQAPVPPADALSFIVPPPAADGGFAVNWQAGYASAVAVIEQMTLNEKATLATGQSGRCIGNTAAIERLGIPKLCLQDGPAGVRPARGVTQFPAGITAAATWDRDLIYQRALAMGKEFYEQGVNVAFAPVTGGPLGRAVLNGRTFEGGAADPYGAGEASYYSVKGIQDAGVIATAKHFLLYEQETFSNRYGIPHAPPANQLPYNSIADDKTTHELYLWPFAEAVRAGVGAAMCSYNLINGTHSCANSVTLNGLLKTELNFQGMVLSDYGAVWATESSAYGGLDLLTPGRGLGSYFGRFFGQELVDAVNNGTLPASRVDDQVIRILTPYFALGQADKPLPSPALSSGSVVPGSGPPAIYRNVQTPETVELVRKIGEDAVVLLKNTNKALPLVKPERILIVGEDAGPNPDGPASQGDFGYENVKGTFSLGHGSGYAIPNNLVDPLSSILNRASVDATSVDFVLNNTNIARINSLAATAQTAIVFTEAITTQGGDRNDLDLTRNGTEIVLATAARCSNTIVVVHTGGSVNLEPFADHPNVTAIVMPLMPGEQTGPSLVRVLYGDVSPSGKLPFTIGKALSDYPPNTIVRDAITEPTTEFTEKLLVDYRFFDANNITPRYEFGYGLSYSTFEYKKISEDRKFRADTMAIQKTAEKFAGQKPGESLYDVLTTVYADVTNSGDVTACEVAQLYVEFPSSEGQPPRQMRGFDKLKVVAAGEKRTAAFPIRRKDIMVWDVIQQQWRLPEGGKVTYRVGASSRDLPLTLVSSY